LLFTELGSLLFLEDFTCSPYWRRISHKLHELLVEDTCNLWRLLFRPFVALIIDILHETLNELVLCVVLEVEILILGGLAAILGRMTKLTTLIEVYIHNF